MFKTLYPEGFPLREPPPFEFKLGDKVRVEGQVEQFRKKYLPTFTTEVFTISKRIRGTRNRYEVTDKNGEVLVGTYYARELAIVRS